MGGGELTIYDNVRRDGEVAWMDLCRGPHLPTTRHIPAFRLTRVARGLLAGQREEPAAPADLWHRWETKDALDAHLDRLAEAERRDHRRLGARARPVLVPGRDRVRPGRVPPQGRGDPAGDGGLLRERRHEAGYEFVNSPHITKAALFETSGHLEWYADGMFPPMHVDADVDPETGDVRRQGQDYYLKPMNCPFHNLIFRARGRSYRELPLRLFEFGTVYRYEKSGVVHGLTRVRGLTMDDAHIYCTREQMGDELTSLLTFVLNLLRDYGLDDFYLELSTRDPDKYVGTEKAWDEATDILRQAAEKSGLELVPDPGGAAFYGPKISVQARDAIGRTWQMSTIQLDFNLPERFDLEYTAADGSRQRPVMIHRALFGSIERFFGMLTEHYAGAFPPWLAPVQVVGIPITDEHVAVPGRGRRRSA